MQKESKTQNIFIDELAQEYHAKLRSYRCEHLTPIESLTGTLELFEVTIEQMQGTRIGLLTPLMRILTHYAATSQDRDKNAVIDYIIGYGGITRLLERVQADSEIIDNIQLLLECLSNKLGKS